MTKFMPLPKILPDSIRLKNRLHLSTYDNVFYSYSGLVLYKNNMKRLH